MFSGKVLILGAGINGAAIARELALLGVNVCVVDHGDIAGGATAYNSRLIHGGLRYLEYGEFSLVRESLQERRRLLSLAPQFVRPLQLFVPVENRWGGFGQATRRFLKLGRSSSPTPPRPRGLTLVRSGLWLYDRLAARDGLPNHQTHRITKSSAAASTTPPFDAERYSWACSYFDAQVLFPERLVIALLRDAQQLAQQQGASMEVLPYHHAVLTGKRISIFPRAPTLDDALEDSPVGSREDVTPVMEFDPAAVVNATGAWVDRTLTSLPLESPRLMGGTKGSHFVTSHERLRAALGDNGVYAEAPDGRPVFLLPLDQQVLVGTTDLPFVDDPAQATATEEELSYLVQAVNRVLPQTDLHRDDIDFHYSGVRPLPYAEQGAPASISRSHSLHWHHDTAIPLVSVIGGKLTTCRSLAEEAAVQLVTRCGETVSAKHSTGGSQERIFPGAENYPADNTELTAEQRKMAEQIQRPLAQIQQIWRLMGRPPQAALEQASPRATHEFGPSCNESQSSVSQSNPANSDDVFSSLALPLGFIRYAIRHEWTTCLEDLVERRLMLLYRGHSSETLNAATLQTLAQILVEEDKLSPHQIDTAVERCRRRLRRGYGRET